MSRNHYFRDLALPFLGMLVLFGCGETPSSSPTMKSSVTPEQRTASAPRVGIVDMQRLSEALGISRQMAEKRKKLQQNWEQVDNATKESITTAIQEFGGEAAKLTDAQRKSLQKLEFDRRRKLAKIDQENTVAIQETNRWLMRVLAEKTEGPINAVGKEMGFDLILTRSPGEVAFSRPGVDVTEKILQRAGGVLAADVQGSDVAPVSKPKQTN